MLYKHHFFICSNKRPDNQPACNRDDSATHWLSHAKARMKQKPIAIQRQVRVSQAGCLGQCAKTPRAVVYPEGVWYTYANEEDINEIVDRHLCNNQIVERLRVA